MEKGFEPKKPLWADNGDGWGVAMIKCFEGSIKIFFDWAYAPHKMKTRFDFLSLKALIIWLVNSSHPKFLCDPGDPDSTVKIEFSNRTPRSAQADKFPSLGIGKFRSVEYSLKIFNKDGGNLTSELTENAKPFAWFGPW